jgi:chromate transporter
MMETPTGQSESGVAFRDALRYWFTLGFINFGGPAGQIAMMHKNLVEERGWIGERIFLRALNFCMLLPGPEAHQLAVYIGWRLNGVAGGLAAGVFFLLPSVALMLFLSWLAAAKGQVPAVSGVFHGIAAAVVAIVLEAVLKIGKKSLRHPILYAFAGVSFILGQFLAVPFPAIVLLAGLGGLVLSRTHPEIFCQRLPGTRECALEEETAPLELPSLWRIVKVTAVFILVWAAVAVPVFVRFGFADILSEISLFFTKAPFVTFGGAYAVLSYITDYCVQLGWMTEKTVLLGLGLAETTPGPLIMVTQYVGFMAAWNQPGAASPLGHAVLGGLLTTFFTFLPSFLFIFALAPFIEALTSNRQVAAALNGITAAVVGVVLKLAVFFAVNTFLPKGAAPDFFAMAVAALSFLAIWRLKPPVHILVLASGLAGLAWRFV